MIGSRSLNAQKVDRAVVDDEYFRVLGTRTGFLFDLKDEDSDTEIGVFGTGSTIEIRQTDYPDLPIADIAKELYAALGGRCFSSRSGVGLVGAGCRA
jgi:hypothetical protein